MLYKDSYNLLCMSTLQSRLLQARKNAKLSQKAVAEAVGISQPTYSDLEKGVSRSSTKLVEIAIFLGVSPEWLVNGTEESISEKPQVVAGPPIRGFVPLISWVQAGEWCEAIDNYQPGDGEEMIPCPFEHGPNAFCLKINGPSMEPEYRDGEVICVDPSVEPRHGHDVVARTADGSVTFKRLQITQDGTYLLAINPDWKPRIMPLPPESHICGVVIGSWMRRII